MFIVPKVLIVDDDLGTQTLLAAVSRRARMEPTAAGDGMSAIAMLAKDHFDVILLDLLLPSVNGFDVLRHIKCTTPSLLQRIIVITAAAAVTTRGCDDLRRVRAFFRKPIDIDELARVMLTCAGETLLPPGTEPFP